LARRWPSRLHVNQRRCVSANDIAALVKGHATQRWRTIREFATMSGGEDEARKPRSKGKDRGDEGGTRDDGAMPDGGELAETSDVLQAVRVGDVDQVKFLCSSLKVEDLKAVLRELGGPVSGTRALLLERILCHVVGYNRCVSIQHRTSRLPLSHGA
jgi:hypothetical protein